MSTIRPGPPLAIALLATAATASTSAQQEPTTSFRSGINAIRVDVIVTDGRGRPIEDLTVEDFEVLEDGRPQRIDEFERVRADGSTSFATDAPSVVRTRLDEEVEASRDDVALHLVYVEPSALTERRVNELVRFVESLPPGDLVGVMDPLSPLGAVAFTRDRTATVSHLRHFADPLFGMRRQNVLLNREWIQPWRTYRALEAASDLLASLREGRQSIILVGGASQLRGGDHEFEVLVEALRRNNTAVHVLEPSNMSTGTGASGPDMPSIGNRRMEQDNYLQDIADRTGGLATTNTNSWGSALERLAADGRFYYLLTYASPAPADGKYHEIRVRVRRQGARVRARPGFVALSGAEMRRAAARRSVEVDRAVGETLAAARTRSPYLHTWVGTARGEEGHSRIRLAWEVVPAKPGERRDEPQRVAVVATSREGTIVYTSDGSPEAAPPLRLDPRGPGGVAFEAPPGALTLRVLVHGSGGLLDVVERSLNLPAVDEASTISTPEVFVGRTAADLQDIRTGATRPPAARREFARTERLLIRVESYETDNVLQGALLNRLGQKLHDVPIAAGDRRGLHEIELGLSHLAAGEYVLEIRDDAGAERALVPVWVRP